MLLEKFFAMRKTESVSMDTHLTEVRNVANLLEEVEVNMPESVIVYYTLKNLPKEYEIFKRMQIAAQTLPTYEQLEAKLIAEETALKMESQKEEGEAFLLHHDRSRRQHSGPRNYSPANSQSSNSIFTPQRNWRSDSGSSLGVRSAPQDDQRGFNSSRQQTYPATNPRGGAPNSYTPKYCSKGPERPRSDKCNLCGLNGHFERECELRSILDRMKDFEHRLLETRNRNLNGQVHHLEEPTEPFTQSQNANDFELADQVVDACLVELNLLETPHPTTSWYLDSGATHHVSGEQSTFSSISQTSGSKVRSAGGHSHSETGVGDVELQLSNGEIKSVGSVLYTPSITKNLLSVGALTDLNKTRVFRSKGCFIINNLNLEVEAFALRDSNHGLYRLTGSHRNREPEVHLLHHSQAELWLKHLGHFHTKGIQRMANYEAVRGLP